MISCIDPVSPEFRNLESQIYVEAIASTALGSSYVIITKSNNEFGLFRNVFEKGAVVTFVNSDTGLKILLKEEEEVYVPPSDFVVLVGETWVLEVKLSDGRVIKSEPEIVEKPVDIRSATFTYDSELMFSDTFNRFVPGHLISVSFDDPIEDDNFYYWRFKSHENLPICQYCSNGKFRGGLCTNEAQSEEFSYSCEVDCWKIRYSREIDLFSDEFTNGKRIENLAISKILLLSKENIVVQVEQFSLSTKAYNYFKVLKDLINNTGGLNSPPPSALLGNLFNPNGREEYIFGRFTAAAASTFSVFIERENIMESPLEVQPPLKFESGLGEVVVTAPCTESRFRTGIRPEGWQD